MAADGKVLAAAFVLPGSSAIRCPMTINFPNTSRSYDNKRNAVRFWGYDQSMEASFFISADALQGLKPGASGDEGSLLQAFDSHRAQICETAAKLYGRSRKSGSYDLHRSDF